MQYFGTIQGKVELDSRIVPRKKVMKYAVLIGKALVTKKVNVKFFGPYQRKKIMCFKKMKILTEEMRTL